MSSPFKTQVQNDLTGVFLNSNEFADPHNINGVDGVICVIDSDITQALRPGLGRYEGAEKEKMTLFISVADWARCSQKEPAYNQIVSVDKVQYRIKNDDLFNGLYELSLEAVK